MLPGTCNTCGGDGGSGFRGLGRRREDVASISGIGASGFMERGSVSGRDAGGSGFEAVRIIGRVDYDLARSEQINRLWLLNVKWFRWLNRWFSTELPIRHVWEESTE